MEKNTILLGDRRNKYFKLISFEPLSSLLLLSES